MKLLPLVVLLFLAGAGAALWALLRGEEESPPVPARLSTPAQEPLSVGRRALFPESHAAPVVRTPPVLPAPWVEVNNEATRALAEGEIGRAIELFERCLAAEPERTVFAHNLAEALVRLASQQHDAGELAPAVEQLSRAIELAGDRADIETLRQILERWRAELELLEEDWTEGSARFALTYDTRRSDILHRSHEVLEHLERSYDVLQLWFGEDPFPSGPPIRVVLYDREEFDSLTGLGDWAGGVFDGVVRVSVEDLSEPQERWRGILVHELVHAFVHQLGGGAVPGWLNEGLAQSLEGRTRATAELRALLRRAELFPLARLQGSLTGWQDTQEIARAYAESLLFVEYLRENYGDEALRRMVSGCRQEHDPAESFQGWSAVPLADAFEDWSESLSR